MKVHPSNLIQISLIFLALLLITSCNKDSDLLAEYVVEDPEVALMDNVVTLRNSSVIIKPSKRNSNGMSKKTTITDVSSPSIGTAVINEDNSITYTPDTDITGTDEFSYTTDVTNTDDTITQETGSITVTITDKTPIPTEPLDMGELKAFPGAEGFGKNATGGRGGDVIFVTNLNASGAGSLQAALDATGPRTVVFRVGGSIDLRGERLYLKNPDITIAGETAPGGGIMLENGSLVVQVGNVIIRHIRVRGSYDNDDCIRIRTNGSPLQNVILDHVSVSWGKDGNIDVSNGWNVTVQNSIIAYNIKSNLVNFNSKNVSYLNNIFALVDQRVIRSNTIDHLDLTVEMINNYLYGVAGPGGPSHGIKVTVENNIAEKSNSFSIRSGDLVGFVAPNPENGEKNTIENSYLYVKGNDLGDAYNNAYASSASSYIESSPLYRSTYEPKPTAGLKELLLANAGAGQGIAQGRDGIDQQIIGHINAKTGTISQSGTWPTISGGTAYTDDDRDGIDDEWELANNLDPKDSNDGQEDRDGDGYTNLEEFLHSLNIIK